MGAPTDPTSGQDRKPRPALSAQDVDRVLDAQYARWLNDPEAIDPSLPIEVRRARARILAQMESLTHKPPPDPVQAKLTELENTVRLLSQALTDLTRVVSRLADERLGAQPDEPAPGDPPTGSA